MARLAYPQASEIPDEIASFIKHVPNLNILRMMSYAGEAMEAFVRFTNFMLKHTRLDGVLREMAIVRVGHRCGSAYEVFQHEPVLRALGVAENKIAALKSDDYQSVLSELEALVVALSDELVDGCRASDKVFEGLSARLSVRELQELVLVIGCYLMVCRFIETYELEIEI